MNLNERYNYSKLLGVMREQHVTQAQLASKIGLVESSINRKFQNCTEFKQSEIHKICKVLGIPIDEVTNYFFIH